MSKSNSKNKNKNKTKTKTKTNLRDWIEVNVNDVRDSQIKRINKSKLNGTFKKPTIHDLCNIKDFSLQEQQTLVAKFINPSTPFKRLLIYHEIGGGKTCAAIQIAENFNKAVIIVPASLKTNFYDELISKCTGTKYISDKKREQLLDNNTDKDTRLELLQEAYDKIEKKYTIMSYNKFFDMFHNNKRKLSNLLTNSCTIIDEIHNLISNTGISYQELIEIVNNPNLAPNFKLVVMTATPIINKANELALLFNLLNIDEDKKLPTDKDFDATFINESNNIINEKTLINSFSGLVSYYPGASPTSFPKKIVNVVRCTMSPFQAKQYIKYRDGEDNNFYMKTRMVSNIAYPNGKLAIDGYKSLTSNDLKLNHIAKYSNKYCTILKYILNEENEGLQFVYCAMLKYGGLLPLIQLFEHHGFVNYETNRLPTKDDTRKRYVLWSSELNNQQKQDAKRVINSKENKQAQLIKIVFGSPAIKEGVSFKRVRDVHHVGPSWTIPEEDQITGRGYRFCSHYDLPPSKRKLKIHNYLSVTGNTPSDEEVIFNTSLETNKLNKKFLKLLKECAIDCRLFNDKNCITYNQN